MFEKASRMKLRFETKKGDVNVEDLWDISLTSKAGFSLDEVAKNLYREIKENEEESFVVKKTSKNEILELKFNIVKHIIDVKMQEKEERESEVLKKAHNEKIARVIEKKENENLENMSVEDLVKMMK